MLFINAAQEQLSNINKAQGWKENQVFIIIWHTKEKNDSRYQHNVWLTYYSITKDIQRGFK